MLPIVWFGAGHLKQWYFMTDRIEKSDIFACDASGEGEANGFFAEAKVAAGFPAPSDDSCGSALNLNSLLVKHPASTFFVRVSGESMRDDAIRNGDILVVDRSVEPYDGCIAVCCIDGEFTLKRIKCDGKKVWLMPSNPDFKPIEVLGGNDFTVWGVVRYSISKH